MLDSDAPGHLAGFIADRFDIAAGVDQGAGDIGMFFQGGGGRIDSIAFGDAAQVELDGRVVIF